MTAQPHLVILKADDLRHKDLGHAGGAALTPALDQLAAMPHAKSFVNCFAGACYCKSARPILSASVPAAIHGRLTNTYEDPNAPGVPYDGWAVGRLQAAGYQTHGFGKRHLGNFCTPTEEGFDTFVEGDDAEMADILQFIATVDLESPLYLEVGFSDPHSPWQPGAAQLAKYPLPVAVDPNFDAPRVDKPAYQDWRELYLAEEGLPEPYTVAEALETDGFGNPADMNVVRQHYLGEVSRLDKQIGRVILALQARGIWDDTLLVVTSDQGMLVYEHRLTFKQASGYDEMLRVPLILHSPVAIGGLDPAMIIEQADIPATILAAAGVALPESFDGTPLSPTWTKTAAVSASYIEEPAANAGHVRVLNTNRYTLVLYENDIPELYDRQVDPWQLVNLGSDHEQYSPLRAQLLEWMEEHDDPAVDLL